ncbi:bacteriocin [Bacteroides sp.]|nr:bacteriocin [Bacteroides sp.]
MKELALNELQQIYGGGFEEGREAGRVFGQAFGGACTLLGIYTLIVGLL